MTTTKGVILNLPFSHIVGSANKPGRIYAFTHRMQGLLRDFSGDVLRETHNYALEKEPQSNPAKKEEFEQLDT